MSLANLQKRIWPFRAKTEFELQQLVNDWLSNLDGHYVHKNLEFHYAMSGEFMSVMIVESYHVLEVEKPDDDISMEPIERTLDQR